MRSKSTKRSSVWRSGTVSYQLAPPGPGRCTDHGGGRRGAKKPFWPSSSARQASPALIAAIAGSKACSHGSKIAGMALTGEAGSSGGRQIVSQNSRSRSTRVSRGLPATIAAFSAPIEMPATQFGSMPACARPSITPPWYAPSAPPPCSTRPTTG